jgi:hypothetical protein
LRRAEQGTTDTAGDDATFAAIRPLAAAGDADAVDWVFTRLQPRLCGSCGARRAVSPTTFPADVWRAVARGVGQFEETSVDFRR